MMMIMPISLIDTMMVDVKVVWGMWVRRAVLVVRVVGVGGAGPLVPHVPHTQVVGIAWVLWAVVVAPCVCCGRVRRAVVVVPSALHVWVVWVWVLQ